MLSKKPICVKENFIKMLDKPICVWYYSITNKTDSPHIITKKEEQPMSIKAYKGFDKNMQCRGFQFAEGETYHVDTAKLCESGFHACEMPLDVLAYYAPGEGSIYREVTLDEVTDESSDDSKRCAKTITIGKELGIGGLINAQLEFVKEKSSHRSETTQAKVVVEVFCDQGAAQASGDRGAAQASGNWGAAQATGYLGAAQATGNRGAAQVTGYLGAAQATGNWGAAQATGDQGAAQATGDQGAAQASGNWGAAQATGYLGAAQATGKASVASGCGFGCRVMGALGCAIFSVERTQDGTIISVASAIVDGEKIKPDTWYKCIGGKFVEAT